MALEEEVALGMATRMRRMGAGVGVLECVH
jgi:hypothetical protein